MKKDEIFQVEKENLEKTINSINRQIEIAQNNFKRQQNIRIGFSEGKRGTQFTRQSFMSLYATQVNVVNILHMIGEALFVQFIMIMVLVVLNIK